MKIINYIADLELDVAARVMIKISTGIIIADYRTGYLGTYTTQQMIDDARSMMNAQFDINVKRVK